MSTSAWFIALSVAGAPSTIGAAMPTLPGLEHHPHARAVLEPALAPGATPSHAYLFHGPAGTGKRTVARALAAQLLGEHDRVARGTHPDLTWVTPSGAHELLVSDVDEAVVAAATRTPFEAAKRVFVIERADTMIEQAANRMLKTLEEPPGFVHLILLTDRLGEVLPTIASRCQHVRFDPLPPERMAQRLRELGVEDETMALACARLALGDGARAAALALGDGPELRAEAEAFAVAAQAGDLASRPWATLLERAEMRGIVARAEVDAAFEADRELLAKRDRRRAETEHAERARRVHRRARTQALDLGLQLVALWFRDLAAVAWGAEDVVYAVDRLPALRATAGGADAASFRRAVELVEETRERLLLNVSEELACEALAYRLEAELGGVPVG
jgi:DNA polymerase III subunit delta'